MFYAIERIARALRELPIGLLPTAWSPRLHAITASVALTSCHVTSFSGATKKNGDTAAAPTAEPTPDPTATPVDPTPTPQAAAGPTGLISTGNVRFAPPDYATCANLPEQGKRKYGACGDGEALVVVNDGEGQEMTCCPLTGANLFSASAEERHQKRTPTCGPGEIATGMESTAGPVILCSKIDTRFLKLGTPQPSIYVSLLTQGLSDAVRSIVASYHLADMCLCPEGTVMIGGHTPSDNSCSDQCVRIEAL